MSDKTDHEDQALQALVDTLVARGHVAAITAHPDRELGAGEPGVLTVDGILTVDGTEWAVDHCLVSRDDRLPSAWQTGLKKLRPPLEGIAREAGLALIVAFQLQDPSLLKTVQRAYFDRVVELARAAAKQGKSLRASDGNTAVQVRTDQPAGAVELATVQTLTGDPMLAAQIREGIGPALTKKLTKQLKLAKDAGYPVMLLLDQHPRPGSTNGTVWSAHSYTVLLAFQPILDAYPGVVDLLWYRTIDDGEVQLLVGDPPEGQAPWTQGVTACADD